MSDNSGSRTCLPSFTRSLDALPNNLPRQLTRFIGREREIEEVTRLLATTSLLTLVGSGGAGKTRLALQVAADLLDAYSDGVWLVELAPLADPSLVPQAITTALGIRADASKFAHGLIRSAAMAVEISNVIVIPAKTI